MINFGDVPAGATIHLPWNTYGADGASITRSTNGTIRIYKDGSDVQRAATEGITDNEDFDGVTGAHLCVIDLADNTTADFYQAGHNYMVMCVGAVVDTKTVNPVIGTFSIMNRALSSDITWITTIATIASNVVILLNRLFTGNLYVKSNVEPESGNIRSLVIGDSYSAAKGTEFYWSNDDWAVLGIDALTCTLTFYARNKDGGNVLLEMEATATSDRRIILEPTSAQTKQLATLAGNNRQGAFQIKATWSDAIAASPVTLVDGLILKVIPNRSN